MIRKTPSRQSIAILAGAFFLLVLPPLAHLSGNEFLVGFASRILILALAAVSLDLILGYGGMVSFGHAAFYGIGGYIVGILSFHHFGNAPLFGLSIGTNDLLVTLPAAAGAAALAALGIGALSLRTSGVHFIMITLAFAQMIYFVFTSLRTYGGDDGISLRQRNTLPFLDLRDAATFYYVCLACLAAFLFFCDRVVHSHFGMVLRGIMQNRRRMAALGYSTYGYQLVAFTFSGAGAVLAGALLANQNKYVSPDMLSWVMSGDLLIVVILGGIGRLYGAVLGAVGLMGLEAVLGATTDHWKIILGPIIVLIVLFTDRGLFGVVAGSRRT